jgi:hypothetical protein
MGGIFKGLVLGALNVFVIAIGIAAMGHEFAMQELVFVSSIPTLVGVLVLERWTRYGEPLPPAQIR